MIEITRGDDVLAIDELGARIRGCRLDGLWVMPDTRDIEPEYAAGDQLFPWPNRLRDGRWMDGDIERRFDITEPARNNAIHGLLGSVEFTAEPGPGTATLRGRLDPSAGYPWAIECELSFALRAGECATRSTFTNLGDRPAPWAFGSHPYIALPGTPESLRFELGASTVLECDEQMIPVGERDVTGTAFDFREPTPLEHIDVDHAFRRDDLDQATIASLASDTARIDVWADVQCGVVQVFRPPTSSLLHRGGPAIAVEPMTAPANALASGDGLRWLEPGASVTIEWGVRVTAHR
ncbi:MAG TPA: galactose mutarotase [Microbacteriaceae bacterium]|nr:galactose mutarotase [Microbacteriaceae bacterium]